MLRSTDIDSRILDTETTGSSETPVNSYQLYCVSILRLPPIEPRITMVAYVLSRRWQGIEPDNNFRPLMVSRDSSKCSKKPDILLHALTTQSSLREWRNDIERNVSKMHENYVCKFLSLLLLHLSQVRSFFSTSRTDTFYLRSSSQSGMGTGERVRFLYRQR